MEKELKTDKIKEKRNFFLGIFVLLAVDLLWVSSAEVSSYIFKEQKYNKPFFTTYLKTSAFIVYLFGFVFVKSWHYQCKEYYAGISAKKILKEVNRISPGPPNLHPSGFSNLNISGETSLASTPGYITPPQFETMTDDDEVSLSNSNDDYCGRKVSFSKVREVRSLAQKHSDAQILSRMSHQSIEDLKNILHDLNNKLPLQNTVKLATYFCILWMFATLSYQEALAKTSPAVTNILSSTSGVFTLILAAICPSSNSDKFNFTKFLSVLTSFGGVVLVILSDSSKNSSFNGINVGDFLALAGAMFYASYLTLIKKQVGTEHQLDMPMFFGFVGLFGILLFWPGFFILHYTGVETFELPPDWKTWVFLLANALIGTVISELLWLWGCFLTSSLMATLSLGLVTPLTMAFDMIFHHLKFSTLFFVGMIIILLGFFVVSLLTHYQNVDPVKDAVIKYFCLPKPNSSQLDSEQRSLLREENEGDEFKENEINA